MKRKKEITVEIKNVDQSKGEGNISAAAEIPKLHSPSDRICRTNIFDPLQRLQHCLLLH